MSYLRKLRPVSLLLLAQPVQQTFHKKRDSSVVPSHSGETVAAKALITISCLFFQTMKLAIYASNENTRGKHGPPYRLHS